MSAFDDRMRAAMARLLRGFGGNATLIRETHVYDPRTGSTSAVSAASATGRVILGTKTIVSEDGKLTTLTIATMQMEPRVGDGLVIGPASGVRYTVQTVEVLSPSGDEPVRYRAVIKR